jgi:hypothetical protein
MTNKQRAYAVFAIKAFHSLAFFVIQSSIIYLLFKGLRHQSDQAAAVAAAIAVGESAIYAGNGFRCPLTALAEDLGDSHGQVTDIFLPKWLADNIARIYTPMLVVAIYLHGRNLFTGKRLKAAGSGPREQVHYCNGEMSKV